MASRSENAYIECLYPDTGICVGLRTHVRTQNVAKTEGQPKNIMPQAAVPSTGETEA